MLKIGDERYYLQGSKEVKACKFVVKYIGDGSYIGVCGTEKRDADLMTQDEAQVEVDKVRAKAVERQKLTADMMAKMCLVQREVCPKTGQIAVQICEGVDLNRSNMTMIGLRARLNPSLQYFYALRETMKNENIVEMVKTQLDVLLDKNMLVSVV